MELASFLGRALGRRGPLLTPMAAVEEGSVEEGVQRAAISGTFLVYARRASR